MTFKSPSNNKRLKTLEQVHTPLPNFRQTLFSVQDSNIRTKINHETNFRNLYDIELFISFGGSWNQAIFLFDIFDHKVSTFGNLSDFEITFAEFIAIFRYNVVRIKCQLLQGGCFILSRTPSLMILFTSFIHCRFAWEEILNLQSYYGTHCFVGMILFQLRNSLLSKSSQ